MPKMTITLQITSLDQLRALETALDMYVGMESQRILDASNYDSARERTDAEATLVAAQALLNSISEG